MSEYQYYEFRAVDQPFDAAQQKYLRSLSSRADVGSHHAIYTYSWSDLPADPESLLLEHCDALLYFANWGSRHLGFRFPQGALDQAALQPYLVYDDVTLTSSTQRYKSTSHLLLYAAYDDDEAGGWFDEPEEGLAPLLPLREDILSGDLRALYLLWLHSAYRATDPDEEDADELVEPPVPPGLQELTPALKALIHFFAIDPDLVKAAAETSLPRKGQTEPFDVWVKLLPEEERDRFLVRVARGESSVGSELRYRLRELGRPEQKPAADTGSRRTYRTLLEGMARMEQQRLAEERAAAERRRLKHLADVAKREPEIWHEVAQALATRTGGGYDRAVAALADLRDLAEHNGQRAAFNQRLGEVIGPYFQSAPLRRRLENHNLI